ncbi:MAG: TolC family outer membrane protein [Candidatus Sedimenticola sp. (ex Thyasira tokunagai)]
MKKTLIPLFISSMLVGAPALGEDLVKIYQLAEMNDAQLRAAQAVRDSAFEAKPQAQAKLLPNLSLTTAANRVFSNVNASSSGASSTSYNKASLTLSLSHPIYHRDYAVQLEQADKQVAQAEVTYAAEKQGLIVRVAQSYFDVLSAQDALEFAQAETAAIERQLDQAKQRFEVGLIAITSVHEAQAAYDQSRADLIQAENVLDNAWEALREITNQPVDVLASVTDELPLAPPKPESIDQWGEGAQQQNLAIQAARLSSEIAKQNIEVKQAGDAPTVDLVGSHALALSASPTGTDSNTTTIGIQLSMPLYNGGSTDSLTRQARLDYQVAQENLDKQRRSVNRQVRDAYRGVVASISSVEALQASTVSAESALEATEAGFEVGTRTMVDVLNAQRDLFRARSNYSKVRYSYIVSGLQLKQAAGTLSADDIQQLNNALK